MDIEEYKLKLKNILGIKDPARAKEELHEFLLELSLTFLDCNLYNQEYWEEIIDLICELALDRDSWVAMEGTQSLFYIIEALCDEFEDMRTESYNRLMAQVIQKARGYSGLRQIDYRLNDFGLYDASQLYARVERLRKTSFNFRDYIRSPKKVIYLSRVTIGADVAVTSVIFQRLYQRFPKAKHILIGNRKLIELFDGHPLLHIEPFDYGRRQKLKERLETWLKLLALIEEIMEDTPPSKVLIVDPDSRLSQLGVFPLIQDRSYLFFNSRTTFGETNLMNISETANYWVDLAFAEHNFCYPAIWLPPEIRDDVQPWIEKCRQQGAKHIVVMNFGVGGNPRKQVSEAFEREIVCRILQDPDTLVILDSGADEEEFARVERIYKYVIDQFPDIPRLSPQPYHVDLPTLGQGLACLQMSIGEMAGIIELGDEYIGYDSAGQHIAAALQTPLTTIFAGSNNPRFVRKWRPCTTAPSNLIHVDTLSWPNAFNLSSIVNRLLHTRKRNLS